MDLDQQDIKNLTEALQDLTKSIGPFSSRKGNASQSPSPDKAAVAFDKGTQKIVNALALLSTSLTKSSASQREQRENLIKFNKAVEKSTEVQDRYQRLANAREKAAADAEADRIKRNETAEQKRARQEKEKAERLVKTYEKLENWGRNRKSMREWYLVPPQALHRLLES